MRLQVASVASDAGITVLPYVVARGPAPATVLPRRRPLRHQLLAEGAGAAAGGLARMIFRRADEVTIAGCRRPGRLVRSAVKLLRSGACPCAPERRRRGAVRARLPTPRAPAGPSRWRPRRAGLPSRARRGPGRPGRPLARPARAATAERQRVGDGVPAGVTCTRPRREGSGPVWPAPPCRLHRLPGRSDRRCRGLRGRRQGRPPFPQAPGAGLAPLRAAGQLAVSPCRASEIAGAGSGWRLRGCRASPRRGMGVSSRWSCGRRGSTCDARQAT